MALESNLADLINDYIIKMGWGKLDEADRWERKNNLENRELWLNNRERRSEENTALGAASIVQLSTTRESRSAMMGI